MPLKPKGGKGNPAPYQTTHVRVPIPIKDRVQQMVDDYRNQVLGADSASIQNHLELLSLEDAKEKARKIVSQRRSAPESLAKLLTAIYNSKVAKDDLT